MTKVFVSNTIPSKDLLGVIHAVAAAGYDKSQAFIGADFAVFAAPLKKDDTAVVYSLTAFHSVTEILSTVDRLTARGIRLRSIQESWFNDPSIPPQELLGKLFQLAERLHTALPAPKRTRRSARSSELAARAAQAYELRATRQLSVEQACRTAGCSVSAYYVHKKKR